METELIVFDEIPLVVPVDLEIPWDTYTDVPSYCGAGEGLGNGLVPEKLWGLNVSIACYIHDNTHKLVKPTWAGLHQSNYIFLTNLLSINRVKSHNWFFRHLRNYRCVTYHNAVDGPIGVAVFCGMHHLQNLGELA